MGKYQHTHTLCFIADSIPREAFELIRQELEALNKDLELSGATEIAKELMTDEESLKRGGLRQKSNGAWYILWPKDRPDSVFHEIVARHFSPGVPNIMRYWHEDDPRG